VLHYRDEPHAEQFTTAPSPDPLVVLVTSGVYVVESRSGRVPVRAVYRPGSVAVTAPHHSSVLRWDALTPDAMESVHVYLDARMVAETAQGLDLRLPGPDLDALTVDNPLIGSAAMQLAWALQRGAPALFADSAAQVLAFHLLADAGPAHEPGRRGLAEKTLRAVVEYLHAHLADHVTLDDLATVAALSKHHLLRQFRASTGQTPARFLTGLRLERAADLLRSTDRPVATIAHQCGYRNPSQFAAAFERRHGTSPAAYRRHLR
jgi:AraC family transcriptional regulator